jgi:hypothetical protein
MVTQFMPENAWASRSTARWARPRDPNNILESLEAVYPGLSGRVQARLDGLGRPIGRRRRAGRVRRALFRRRRGHRAARLRKNDVSIGNNPDSYFNMALTPEKGPHFPAAVGLLHQI